jgi:hypothetical protein
MNWQALRDKAQRTAPPPTPGHPDLLTEQLAGTAAGLTVHVVMPGGSLPAEVTGPVIACDGAIADAPQAAVWLMLRPDGATEDWFPGHNDFAGVPVFTQFVIDGLDLDCYPDEFWERVLWTQAGGVFADFAIRRHGHHGLAGGVHLAGIMGAAEVYVHMEQTGEDAAETFAAFVRHCEAQGLTVHTGSGKRKRQRGSG